MPSIQRIPGLGERRGRRKTPLAVSLALALVAGVIAWEKERAAAPSSTISHPEGWQVFFSPNGGCTNAVVAELGSAKSSVLVQAYSFTSGPIAKALADAKRRGVEVRVLLDKSQRSERYTSADFIAHAGIPVLIDDKHAIAHNKVMVIDADTVITGSFNFTKAAETGNAENLLIIRGAKELARQYGDNWARHRQHSVAYPLDENNGR